MFTPDPSLDLNNKCMTDEGTSRDPAGAAPAGDIGGTNPGIITTTLLTRENLQQAISRNISGVINILSREVFLINPMIFREISLNASLGNVFVRKYYQSGREVIGLDWFRI